MKMHKRKNLASARFFLFQFNQRLLLFQTQSGQHERKGKGSPQGLEQLHIGDRARYKHLAVLDVLWIDAVSLLS